MAEHSCFNCKHSKFVKDEKYGWLVSKCDVRTTEDGEPYKTDIFTLNCEEWEKV